MDAPSRPGGHRTVVGVQQPPSPHARDTHGKFDGAPRTVQPVHERAGEQAAVMPWLLGGTGCSSGLPAGAGLLAPPSWLLVQEESVPDGEEGRWSRGTGPPVLLVRVARVAGGDDLAADGCWIGARGKSGTLVVEEDTTVVAGAIGNGGRSSSWRGRCRGGWTEGLGQRGEGDR
jgi:hypothetical protein